MSVHQLNHRFRRFGLLESSTQSAVQYPPKTGLVGYWSMNEGTGISVIDYSGNGNNGVLAGTNLPTWVTGKISYGLSCNASSAYIAFPQPISVYNIPSFSICCWLKPSSLSGVQSVIDCNNQSNYGWVLNLNQASNGSQSAGKISFYMFSGGTFINGTYSNSQVLTTGQWTHLSVTYSNGGIARLYVNGSTTDTTATSVPSGITYSNNTFTIGRDVGNGSQYLGVMDEILFYNRELSQSEVTTIFNQL